MSDWKTRAKPVEDWKSRAKPVAEAGTPLAEALASQTGDVVTVETPGGPAQFDRQGRRVYSSEEAQQYVDAATAPLGEGISEAALSFLAGGGPLIDEMRGVGGAIRSIGTDKPMLDAYRDTRDETRNIVARATSRASPTVRVPQWVPKAGGVNVPVLPVAGALLPSMLSPLPATGLGRVFLAGEQGAQTAAEASTADLTRGEVADFGGEVGRGFGLGLAVGGVGEAVGAGANAIARGAGSRIGDSVATRAAKDQAAVAAELASLRGQIGGESQKMSRLFENTQRAAGGGVAPAGQSIVDPALQGRAVMALSDPAAKRLQEKVLERSLLDMPGQASTVERLEQELAAATARAPTEASRRTSDYFAQSAFETEVAPRLGRLAYNAAVGGGQGAIGGAALGVGSVLSGVGDPLTAAGVGLATGVTQGLGKSAITMSRNLQAAPRAQVGALESLIQASMAGRTATARASQSVARASKQALSEEEDVAVRAFLSGG
jgi:hypothetical protein